jgi:4-amino-4-deoxy-L-arabinose transferase-like glycosyltransferase
MNKLKTGVVLLSIIIIATFFRLHHIKTTPPGLYPDEAVNAYDATLANKSGDYKVYYPENNGREGLFMNVQAFAIKAFGIHEPWVLRFPSAIFGILTVLGMYFIGRELFDKRIGLLAAFFTATNVWHITFSRIGFRAITAPFFLVFALGFLLYALRKADTGSKRPWYLLLAAFGGIIFGLGFYSYIAYRVVPLLLIPFAIFMRKQRAFWEVMGVFLIVTFFVALPIGLYYLHHPADFFGRTSEISIFSQASPVKILGENIAKTVGMFFVYGDSNWRHNYSGRPELFWPVALCFALGLVAGISWLIHSRRKLAHESRKETFSFVILFSWIFLAGLPVVMSSEGLPHALRSIILIPPAMLFAAFGGMQLYDFLKRHVNGTVLAVGMILILSTLVYEPYVTYFEKWANNPNVPSAYAADQTELAHKINALPRSEPVYIVADGGGIDAQILNPFDGTINEKAGFPLASQVIMFITDTFTPEDQKAHNIYYLLPKDAGEIPAGATQFTVR